MARKTFEPESEDIRVRLITKIWGVSMGMLGISIPLAAITESGPVIPLAVIIGTSLSTVAIWRNGNSESLPSAQFKQLEERLANLETIVTYEEQEQSIRAKIQRLKTDV